MFLDIEDEKDFILITCFVLVKEPEQLSGNILSHRDDLIVCLKRVNHPDNVGVVELLLNLTLRPQGVDVLVTVTNFWDEF